MGKFTDWLAATLYISDEDIQTHRDVAASQSAAVDRQRAEGKRGWLETYALKSEISDAGDYQADFKEKNSGLGSLVMTAPLWLWVVMLVGAFWYLGGFLWLKGILARQK